MNIFYQDEDGWFGWSENDGVISLHMEIYKWDTLLYKKCLHIFASFLNTVKGRQLYSVAKTEQARKFNELFGLEVIGKENGWFIMGIKA